MGGRDLHPEIGWKRLGAPSIPSGPTGRSRSNSDRRWPPAARSGEDPAPSAVLPHCRCWRRWRHGRPPLLRRRHEGTDGPPRRNPLQFPSRRRGAIFAKEARLCGDPSSSAGRPRAGTRRGGRGRKTGVLRPHRPIPPRCRGPRCVRTSAGWFHSIESESNIHADAGRRVSPRPRLG